MSSPISDALLNKIADLYREFQSALHRISHEHLQESKELLSQIDEVRQEELRQKIREG